MPDVKRVAWLATDFTQFTNGSMVPGGCSYYRCYLPMNMVPHDGMFGLPAFDAIHGFGVRDSEHTAQFGFKVAVLKLLMERWVPKQIELAKNVGQRIVIDIDDFYPGLDESNQAFHATDPATNKVRNRDIYARTIEMADMLITSTPFLYEYYKPVNPNILLVRNGVSPGQFQRKQVDGTRRPVIGWVGATPWRSNDLEPLREWLPQFLEANDLHFHHAGVAPRATSFADIVGIPEERFSSSPMVPMTDYESLFPPIDIGIIPLSDIPFNHAKSTIKGLEYTCCGIPWVAQGLPEYERLADMGVGRVAYTRDDWQRELSRYLNARTRAADEEQNYRMMLQDHSIMARAVDWKDAIEMAFDVPVKEIAA